MWRSPSHGQTSNGRSMNRNMYPMSSQRIAAPSVVWQEVGHGNGLSDWSGSPIESPRLNPNGRYTVAGQIECLLCALAALTRPNHVKPAEKCKGAKSARAQWACMDQ